ncbi:MAG: LCP family protein, partial [Epulopiscium sp.]|nr:LCP family protein [Candidatus Epulonipiscium sp.]
MSSNQGNQPKRKKSMAMKFFGIVFLIVFSFLIIAGGATLGYLYKNRDIAQGEEENPEQTPDKAGIWDIFKKPNKRKINVAVFGVDADEIRTDVIIIASFDTKTKAINLLSIPRDTRIELTELRWKEMQDNSKNRIPKVVKLNEVHAYAGKGRRNQFSVDEL